MLCADMARNKPMGFQSGGQLIAGMKADLQGCIANPSNPMKLQLGSPSCVHPLRKIQRLCLPYVLTGRTTAYHKKPSWL
jgi:hypothetical protein